MFEEEFLFEMEINQSILDYLKNKKALINLVVSKNNTNFLELQNNIEKDNNKKEKSLINDQSKNLDLENFDSEDEDLNIEKEILGSCKFSLNEILTDPDFSNKILDVISNNNSNLNLGYINFDFKLENSASVEGKIGKSNTERINKNVAIRNIKFIKIFFKNFYNFKYQLGTKKRGCSF